MITHALRTPLCRRVAIPLAVAAALLVSWSRAPAGRAQTPGASVVVNQFDASAYPDLRAVVTVLTPEGVPAAELPVQAFRVAGDEPVDVAAVTPAQDASLPLGIAIVIDTSGSMQGAPIASARAAAAQLIDQLGPGDQAAIVAFSDEPHVIVPFTADRTALTAGIDRLEAGGPTALYAAVQTAAYAARASGLPRQAVVLLSDGENDTTDLSATADGTLRAVRGARVPVFTVAYGDAADAGYLRQLAAESRGAAFAATQFDVARTYAAIGALLRSQYVLALRAGAPADGRETAIRIAADVGGVIATSDAVKFARGAAPAPPPAAPAAAPPKSSGVSGTALGLVALAAAGLAAAAAVALWSVRAAGRARAQRERDRHAGQVADLPVPAPRASALAGERAEERAVQLLRVTEDGATRAFEVRGTPLTIGTARDADIHVPADDRVASRHATVWVADGNLRLRHIGGARPTLFNGRPIDVMVLEPGDEFAVGCARFVVGARVSADAVVAQGTA